MRWMVPKLHQTQEFVLEEILEYRRVPLVNGFAGSGKSIVAVHLCKEFRTREPSAKIALITYTRALKEMLQVGLDSLSKKEIVVTTHTDLIRTGVHYDIIVLDEVQDIPLVDIRRIQAMCGRLFLFGDFDQSIYPDGVSINDLRQEMQLRKLRLRKNFRLTEKVRRVAKFVLPDAKLVAGDTFIRADPDIKRAVFTDYGDEAIWVYGDAADRARPDYPSGILLTTHNRIYRFAKLVAERSELPDDPPKPEKNGGRRNYDVFNAFWEEKGYSLRFLGSGSGVLADSRDQPIVYLMTYHSAKGLDFRNVYLPFAVPGMNLDPLRTGDETLERRLMFVAVTRTRENLFITHTGAHAHRYIEEMPSDDVEVIYPEPRKQEEDDNGIF